MYSLRSTPNSLGSRPTAEVNENYVSRIELELIKSKKIN